MQENSHRKHDMPELKIVNKKMTPINIPNTTELSIHTTNDDNTNNNINHNTAAATAAAPFDIKNHFDLKLKARIGKNNNSIFYSNNLTSRFFRNQKNKLTRSKRINSSNNKYYRSKISAIWINKWFGKSTARN